MIITMNMTQGSINEVALQVSAITGQSQNNVHASISRQVKALGLDAVKKVECTVENNVFSRLEIDGHIFERGKSNKWNAVSPETKRAMMLNKQALELASQMVFVRPPAISADDDEHEQVEAFVFEHKGQRIMINVTDDADEGIL